MLSLWLLKAQIQASKSCADQRDMTSAFSADTLTSVTWPEESLTAIQGFSLQNSNQFMMCIMYYTLEVQVLNMNNMLDVRQKCSRVWNINWAHRYIVGVRMPYVWLTQLDQSNDSARQSPSIFTDVIRFSEYFSSSTSKTQWQEWYVAPTAIHKGHE